MCGICGISYKDTSHPVSDILIKRMMDCIHHRGPDASGRFIKGSVGLGHTRLSIIDVASGAQPMFNADKSLVLVYNGELYNYLDLRAELLSKGYPLKTKSDTEVLLYAYQHYGVDCLRHLQGMFAFAIYDIARNQIFIARDRLGIKPLYYHNGPEAFCFASEIKPILSAKLVERKTNAASFDFFMNLGYVPAPWTMFNEIYKLSPGHYILYKDGDISINKYWSPRYEPKNASYSDCEAQLEAMLNKCINSHLMSEVPLGVFLSGGLDSSAVTSYMSDNSKQVKTFSVGFDDSSKSELSYAKIIADCFKTEHHEFILTPSDFFDAIHTFLHFSEEPIVEGAAIALYRLSQLAKPLATVLLSGEGADEILAGYPIYRIGQYVRLAQKVFSPVLRQSIFQNYVSQTHNEKLQKYFEWAISDSSRWYHTVPSDVTPGMQKNIYTDNYGKSVDGKLEQFFSDFLANVECSSDLGKMLLLDMAYWLPDDLLLKADKMTMAASIELRVPFLDHKLVEYALTIPDRYKLNGSVGKFILKRLMEKRLPKEIIYRKKMGFPLPTAEWFRNELYDSLNAFLLDPSNQIFEFCRRDYVKNLIDAHKNRQWDASRRILSLVIFEAWHRQYIIGDPLYWTQDSDACSLSA